MAVKKKIILILQKEEMVSRVLKMHHAHSCNVLFLLRFITFIFTLFHQRRNYQLNYRGQNAASSGIRLLFLVESNWVSIVQEFSSCYQLGCPPISKRTYFFFCSPKGLLSYLVSKCASGLTTSLSKIYYLKRKVIITLLLLYTFILS